MSREQFEAWYMENWGFTEDDIETLFERSPDCHEDYYRLGVRLAHHSWLAATQQAEVKCAALAAENAVLKAFGGKLGDMHNDLNGEGTGIQGRAEVAIQQVALEAAIEEFDAIKTPSTDAFLAEVRAISLEDFADVMADSGHYDAANYATKQAHKIRQEAAQ